ncbi:IS5 family transposase [Oligella sp. HMSC09E12]|uniref:IS5 family transposase n=1 Tax=Oligella sp. HMSC09E12 TaxID=1581147 RepID=UPI0008A3A2AE|nr:IS5 family transposase [Oligella sp. HMSC09E12]OFV47872.1 transposase [Oligella sp. HMSC09E12]
MQITFAEAEFTGKKKQTRRDRLLADPESPVPWAVPESVIEPHYPKTDGKQGRPAMGLSRMLRMYILQQVMGFSDEGTEDAVYDSAAIQLFMGIVLGRDAVPDATTLLRFRRLLETHGLTRQIFAAVNYRLAAQGLYLKEGTVVDATIISAPPSIKNESKSRDPEMRHAKKGNRCYFGMKAHIGVDAASGPVHTLVTTPANTHDVTRAHALLHGEEQDVYGDSGYQGAGEREENKDKKVNRVIAMRHGKRRKLRESGTEKGRLVEKIEQLKSRIRAKVEHPFYWVKVHFGHRKTRYRGLAKNTAQLYSLFALANLFLSKRFMPLAG